MPEEIFDVVDESDRVVSQAPRSEIHRLGLRHRAVHILVFNRKGELFLQKRSLKKDCFPGAWDSSAAGHLDAGESYDHCALRELHEELGLILHTPPDSLFDLPASPGTGQEFCRIYRCHSDGPFQLHPDEIESGDWFAPAAIDRWTAERPADFASAFLLIWERYRRLPAPDAAR